LRIFAYLMGALTSLSWLLPVELTPDGTQRVAIHCDDAIVPAYSFQCYGIEDPRISRVDGRCLMATCSVSPERPSTMLYTSNDGIDWDFVDIILDHQNKDMLLFEGLIHGHIGRRRGHSAICIRLPAHAQSAMPRASDG
jgi:predicted GH43/DUF377 family glycosyl hydrolase